MPPILNGLNVECACVGNHDLDFGLDRLGQLAGDCNFPWLLTNVTDARGDPFPGTIGRKILNWDGVLVGMLGIVEQDWIDTCGSLHSADVKYEDMIEAAKKGVEELRQEGAHVVIGLTHMRTYNDKALAEANTGLDIILGGHDHDYEHFVSRDTHVVKSGSDFQHLSVISITVPYSRLLEGHMAELPVDVAVRRFDITAEYPKDEKMGLIVKDLEGHMAKRLAEPAAVLEKAIDARFATIRSRESAIGNWITDVARWYYDFVKADCCILQGGCIRANREFPPGVMTVGDLLSLCPIQDSIIVIEVAGSDLHHALELALSKVPALEGRFPCLSGLRVKYDSRQPPQTRIVSIEVKSREPGVETYEPLRNDGSYRLVTSDYLARGNDGYSTFARGERIVDNEQGIMIQVLLRRYLFLQRIISKLTGFGPRFLAGKNTNKGMSNAAQMRASGRLDELVRKAGMRAMGHAGLQSMHVKAAQEKRRSRYDIAGPESSLGKHGSSTALRGGATSPLGGGGSPMGSPSGSFAFPTPGTKAPSSQLLTTPNDVPMGNMKSPLSHRLSQSGAQSTPGQSIDGLDGQELFASGGQEFGAKGGLIPIGKAVCQDELKKRSSLDLTIGIIHPHLEGRIVDVANPQPLEDEIEIITGEEP